MHTLLGLHGNIPTFIRVTSGDVGDVNILGEIMPEAGAFYVMDRGYIDFQRLYVITLSSVFLLCAPSRTCFSKDASRIQWTRARACACDTPNESPTVTWNSSANRMNSQFVLRKCPKGFTGYECRFDYDYFFRIKIENLPEPIYMKYWISSKLNESIIPPSID